MSLLSVEKKSENLTNQTAADADAIALGGVGSTGGRDEAVTLGGQFNRNTLGSDASAGGVVAEDSVALGGSFNTNTIKGDEYKADNGSNITINQGDAETAKTFADTVKEIVATRESQVTDEIDLATDDDGSKASGDGKKSALTIVFAVLSVLSVLAFVVGAFRKAKAK